MDDIHKKCKQTIDLEDFIMEQQKKTRAIIVATYKSGRTEEFYCKLLKGELLPKKYMQIFDDLRQFPTVDNVKIIKE